MYRKKVAYINYIENGIRIKNAGHVKILWKDNSYMIDMQIKGLYATDSMLAELHFKGAEKAVGRLCIDKGSSYYNASFSPEDVDGMGTRAEKIEGLVIYLSEQRKLEAEWAEKQAEEAVFQAAETTFIDQLGEQKKNNMPAAAEAPEEMQIQEEVLSANHAVNPEENILHYHMPEQKEKMLSKSVEELGRKLQAGTNWRVKKETPEEPFRQPQETRLTEEENRLETETREKLYENKWEQLLHTYSRVHPFGKDQEEYINIAPKDFVILREAYQQLVNNSFLLHGFYNYGHIILGKKRMPEPVYYLGVPGTYYDREKMVAVMFGFESFEAAGKEESDIRIDPGTFGYYLRTVEL